MRSFYKIFKQKCKKNKISDNNIVPGDVVTYKTETDIKHIGVVLRVEKILKLDMADIFWTDSTMTVCSTISLKRL
ncbi:MAG TPA: hypothetical protein EYQ21_06935 [Flavobacteriales bacterium]|jgi:uncharacterized protein YijF (DUF1287 family)|nr:hypothetical protein [Flavobacteriales bacterium]